MKTLNRIFIAIITLIVLVVLPFSEFYHEIARTWHNFTYWGGLKDSWKKAVKDGVYFFKLGKLEEDKADTDARIKKAMGDL